MRRRVVITGLGVVSAVGIGKDAFWDSVVNGNRNYSEIDRFDTKQYLTKIAALIRDFHPEKYVDRRILNILSQFKGVDGKPIPYCGLSLQYALAASNLAINDSGLDLSGEDKKRIGVILGSTIADISLIRNIGQANPWLIQYGEAGTAAGLIALIYRLQGISYGISAACASGSSALICGLEKIILGKADLMIVGSTAAPIVAPHPYEDFIAKPSPMTSQNLPMSPFDKDRDGFVLGEGAGILVIEELEHARNRNATIYAEIVGCGQTTFPVTHLANIKTEGYTEAMQNALNEADLKLWEACKTGLYIHAHGSATRDNDKVEMEAIKNLFLAHWSELYISSIKGTTGHSQEAASALELAAVSLALHKGIIPPSTNIVDLDPEFKWANIVQSPLRRDFDFALCNSAGFGNVYSTILLQRYQ